MASLDGWGSAALPGISAPAAPACCTWIAGCECVDDSDLVQESLQRALACEEPCRGQSDRERIAWLERIQDRVLY